MAKTGAHDSSNYEYEYATVFMYFYFTFRKFEKLVAWKNY